MPAQYGEVSLKPNLRKLEVLQNKFLRQVEHMKCKLKNLIIYM